MIEVLIAIDSSNNSAISVGRLGTHAGPVNSGIVVNGVVAAVTADQFVALNVPVAEDGIITAKLTALDGSHGTAQLTVGLNEQPYRLSLSPSSTEGIAPHSVSFDWNAYTTEAPTNISIDYDGDGVYDQTSSDLTTPLQHNYTAAAISNVTLRITMADGSQYSKETTVVTHDSEHYDAIFLSLWDGMNGALLAGEPLVALNNLNTAAQSRFYVTFRVIAPNMQSVIDSYQPHARGEITDSYLEYLVPRNINGNNKIYVIYSLRGMDGIWRIDSM